MTVRQDVQPDSPTAVQRRRRSDGRSRFNRSPSRRSAIVQTIARVVVDPIARPIIASPTSSGPTSRARPAPDDRSQSIGPAAGATPACHGGNSARRRRGSRSRFRHGSGSRFRRGNRRTPTRAAQCSVSAAVAQSRGVSPRRRGRITIGRRSCTCCRRIATFRRTATALAYGVTTTVRDAAATGGGVAGPAAGAADETGFLQLEVEPRQRCRSSSTVSTSARSPDIGDEIELRLGARRIELRAPGYRTLVFDTRDRVRSHDRLSRRARADLERTGTHLPCTEHPAPQAPKAPAVHLRHPSRHPHGQSDLRDPGLLHGQCVAEGRRCCAPGCDISKLTTISPQ